MASRSANSSRPSSPTSPQRPALRRSASGISLDSPGWHSAVRDGLSRFIKENTGRGLPVAFDFDNTLVAGDIGEATLAVLARRGLLPVGPMPDGVSPVFRDRSGKLISPARQTDVTVYYEKLLDSTMHGSQDPHAFSSGYVWAVEAMAGLPLTALVDATAEAFSLSRPGQLVEIPVTPGRTGYPAPFFIPEMVELLAQLIRHNFSVWIVSASNVWTVRWMVLHGLNPLLKKAGASRGVSLAQVRGVATLLADRRKQLWKDSVLARENRAYARLDRAALEPFHLTSRLQFPVATYSGKVACLWDALEERPALAAGDSPGDHAMLSFAQKRLWVARMNKPDYQAVTAPLIERTGRATWLIQPALAAPYPGFQPSIQVPAGVSGDLRKKIMRSVRVLGLAE